MSSSRSDEPIAPPPPELIAQAVAAAAADSDNEEDRQREEGSHRRTTEGLSDAGGYRTSDRIASADEHSGDQSAHMFPEVNDSDVPPPAYGDIYGQIGGDNANASVTEDGRVNIHIHQRSRTLSQILVPALREQLDEKAHGPTPPPPYIPPSLGGAPGQRPPPPLNVVIHVVGSRGDVQPFLSLGKVLKETYGHRVRLATHPVFKGFIEENGLEFFSIGGDPSELMAFMVKNPGLMPGFDTLRSGDIGKRRKNIADMVAGCWRSCIEAGDGTGAEASDNNILKWVTSRAGINVPVSVRDASHHGKPFIADAIIANPPSFAHVHCAEKLGVPLHMMFTMPWSPTQAFPHPLANIQSSDAESTVSNFMSYALVDMMTWQGLGDIINRFRVHSLGLEPVSLMWAPGMLARLRVPFTYCWSPALIPKPKDWAPHISISGFYFLSLASNFTPDPDLLAFLNAGPPPAYIGFGSIVVEDPNAMTKLIFDAVRKTGQRALVSKGWGGFGADQLDQPDEVFMLGNVPHDWLFKQVSCVVHHGGAGTTAAGIAAGKPTVVVPFFGDQPFWGAMVARAGAGPAPIPHKQLTADKLAAAILEALKPTSLERARELCAKISEEKGSDAGAQSFHQMLDVDKLRCSLLPDRPAVWRMKRTQVRLSALAAATLAMEGHLDFADVKLSRAREYDTDDGPWDPISGGASALVGTLGSMMMGVADLPVEALKALKIHPTTSQRAANAPGSSNNTSDSAAQRRPNDPSASSAEGSATWSATSSPNSELTPSGTITPQVSVTEYESSTDSTISLAQSQKRPPRVPSPDSVHGASMAHALRESSGDSGRGSRGHSPFPPHRQGSSADQRSGEETPGNHFGLEAALGTGKGVSRMVGAGLKSPMDFSLALSKGFHNAPKLYGDDTVRSVDKVTGFQSGLKTATKELGLGFYDGISGIVTQPILGAKKEGAAGFMKGVGKGIAGLILKPAAGIYGIPGYAMKGTYAELQKMFGSSVHNYIIAARTSEGHEAYLKATRQERDDIVHRWLQLKKDLKKKNSFGAEQLATIQKVLTEHKGKRRPTKDKRGEKGAASTSDILSTERTLSPPAQSSSSPSSQQTPFESHGAQSLAERAHQTEDAELEEAIRRSVAQTSTGDPGEAELIDRAIRASLAELQRSHRAGAADEGDDEDDEEAAIQRAVHASIADAPAREPQQPRRHGSDSEWDGSEDGSGDGDDEDLRSAIERSMRPRSDADADDDEEEELRRAVGLSREAHAAREAERARARSDEEIVLEYVMRQSLAEEEHRRTLLARGGR